MPVGANRVGDSHRKDMGDHRLRNKQQAELIRAEPPPLPGDEPYHVIVADPRWLYEMPRSPAIAVLGLSPRDAAGEQGGAS
jgi:hypothetical protein